VWALRAEVEREAVREWLWFDCCSALVTALFYFAGGYFLAGLVNRAVFILLWIASQTLVIWSLRSPFGTWSRRVHFTVLVLLVAATISIRPY
jgi:hypothetical protein